MNNYYRGEDIRVSILAKDNEDKNIESIDVAEAAVLIYNVKQAPVYTSDESTDFECTVDGSTIAFTIASAETTAMPVGLIEVELKLTVEEEIVKRRMAVGYLNASHTVED